VTEPCVAIQNRKYLGSKNRLLAFLESAVLERCERPIGLFLDPFSGTGVVADRFRDHAAAVVANDLLYSNYVTNRAFLATDAGDYDAGRLSSLLGDLNRLSPSEGYVTASYGGLYFTRENARLIDSRREAIAAEPLSDAERFLLLASLLYAADKVANTAGQYDAFLKSLGASSYDEAGRHRVDGNVYGRLQMRMPVVRACRPCEVHNGDALEIVSGTQADVLYLDPPYNTRQYSDLYHVLENIAVWRKPPLHGKTRKFDRTRIRSRFSARATCREALRELVLSARARHIFVSYNSEGVIPRDEIVAMLDARGPVEVLETDYGVFGNGAGRSVKRRVRERLYYCRVES
jgi:adenine-specific DNA-methyltransferase